MSEEAPRCPGYFHHADERFDVPVVHCLRCGATMEGRVLAGESKPRLVCTECEFIFYQNPKVVVATLLEAEGRVVLVRRSIEPRRGSWTYPGGFLELGESLEEGALRETKEETNLDARINGLLNVYSRPEAGVVVVVYRAAVTGGTPSGCDEVDEIGCFLPAEIPWNDLAFPTTEWALLDWLEKAPSGSPPSFSLREG